jgi:hypothetical protein
MTRGWWESKHPNETSRGIVNGVALLPIGINGEGCIGDRQEQISSVGVSGGEGKKKEKEKGDSLRSLP